MVYALMPVAYLGQPTSYACRNDLDDGQLLGADAQTNHRVEHRLSPRAYENITGRQQKDLLRDAL